MPELPEVETTINGLKKKVLGRTFLDIWTDFAKTIKKPSSLKIFRKDIIGRKIKGIRRRGKNIIFELSGNKILLIHQKLTGHFLVGNWKLKTGNWKSEVEGPLEEKINSYIHLMFFLDNNQMLGLSDLRKFAKVELWKKKDFVQSKEIKELGPEPLERGFTFEKFKERIKGKKAAKGPLRPPASPKLQRGERSEASEPRQRRSKIKQILMDQTVIAGIGNIYSDEILFEAKIHPFRKTSELKERELRLIFQAIKKILRKAVKLGGTSISDFRDTEGRSGFFGKERKVYQREGEKCQNCGTIIKRVKMSGRSAHFCPQCQN